MSSFGYTDCTSSSHLLCASLCAPRGGGNDTTRDEVAERQPKTIAVVGEAIEIVVLVAVLDPDLVPRDLPGDVHHGLEADVVRGELRPIIRDTGQVVVVVAGQEGDLHPLAGLAKLAEQGRMLRGDGLELGDARAVGQLPEAEGIADDDELGGLRSRRDLPQELDELVLELALGESPVTADVEVTDEVIGRRHGTRTISGVSQDPRGRARSSFLWIRVSLPNSPCFACVRAF